jgi:hypothetical protein
VNWKPSPEHDNEIRRWMKAKGWEVNRTEYDPDRELYIWRHQGQRPERALRITREVLEAYPASAVVAHLQRLGVAHAIRHQSHLRWVVAQQGPEVVLMAN